MKRSLQPMNGIATDNWGLQTKTKVRKMGVSSHRGPRKKVLVLLVAFLLLYFGGGNFRTHQLPAIAAMALESAVRAGWSASARISTHQPNTPQALGMSKHLTDLYRWQ